MDVSKQFNEANKYNEATTSMTRTDFAILELIIDAFSEIVGLAARDADSWKLYFLIDTPVHLKLLSRPPSCIDRTSYELFASQITGKVYVLTFFL